MSRLIARQYTESSLQARQTSSRRESPRFLLRPLLVWGWSCWALTLGWANLGWSQDDAAAKVTFDDDVKGVLRQRCAACHSPDKKSGGLDLTNYTALMQGGSSGASVEPGDASGSYLYMLVTHEEEPVMPPGGTKIPDAELAVIERWINGGALENKSSKASVKKKKSFEMAASGNLLERPAQVFLPPHLPLEPVLATAKPSCATATAVSPWAPLAAVAAPHQVLLYHTQSLELLGVLPFPEGIVNTLRFSRDGRLLLAGGGKDGVSGKVVVWEIPTGRRQMEVGDELDTVLAADLSSDLRFIALGGPQRIVRVYSTADGSLVYECTKHTDWVTALAFSPDGVLLATGDRAGNAFVWETPTGNEYLALRGHTDRINDLNWRIDSNLVATASQDTAVRLWEMENGSTVKAFNAHGGGTTAVTFTRDGNLVTNGRDRVPKLWNQNGELQKQFSPLSDIGTTVAYCHETQRVLAGDWLGQLTVNQATDAAVVGQLVLNPPPLETRVTQAEAAVAAVAQVQQPATEALAAATAQMNQAQEALNQLTTQHQQTITQMNQWEQQLTETQQTLVARQTEKVSWQKELDEKTSLLPGLSELCEKSRAVAALSPADAELQSTAALLGTKLETLKAQLQTLQNQLTENSAQTALLEQTQTQLTQQLAAKKTEAATMTEQLAAMQTQMPSLQQAVAEKTNLVAEVQQKLAAAQQLLQKWQSERNFISQLQTLESRIAAAEQELQTQAEARAVWEQKLAEVQKQLQEAQAREAAAQKALEEVQREADSLQGILQ